MTPNPAASTHRAAQLQDEGLCVRTGPLTYRIHCELPDIAVGIARLYEHYPLADPQCDIVDYHVRLASCVPSKRLQRIGVIHVDGQPRFEPFPRSAAIANLEWGLNGCVTRNMHRHLALHAAALEQDGQAVIIAGPSGSGKSTLAAAMMLSGWRLLAEELTLIDIHTGRVTPVPRPVCLKNQAISHLQAAFPSIVLGPTATGTRKGTIAHVRPLREHIEQMPVPAEARALVFCSRSETPAEPGCSRVPKAHAMMQAVTCSFNYRYLGRDGFNTLGQLVDRVECVSLCYHDAVSTACRIGELLQAEVKT